MKKLSLILLSMLLIFTLAACGNKCEHTYDNACDATCNECGEVREVGAHDYEAADCDTAKTCKICGATGGEALGHTAEADDGNCTTDIKCATCGAVVISGKTQHVAHADDGDCTTPVTCTECSIVITEAKSHDFSGAWEKDASGHWHVCKNDGCSVTDTKADHIFDGSATEEKAEKCTVCEYVITPELDHTHNHNIPKYDTENHWIECACGDKSGITAHTPNEDDNDCTTAVTCKDCEAITTSAKSHTPNADDGDCTTAITCSVCGEVAIPAGQHTPDENTEYTYRFAGGGLHLKMYACCGNPIGLEECSGGTTTCISYACCRYCNGSYGQADPSNHAEPDSLLYYPNYDGTHRVIYPCCSTKKAESEPCFGGTATCGAKAACAHCGTAYGELDLDNHDLTTVDNNGVCGCGQILTFVITNSGVNTNYDSFADALAAWTDGTTLTLFSDVTDLTETIKTTAKGLTLDLNGHSLASTATRTLNVDGASELTIRDSKDSGQIKGTVLAGWSSSHGCGTLLLESGTLEEVSVTGIFTMTGGSIRNDNGSALYINCAPDTVLIAGGEIYGSTYGVSISSGNVTISGDTKITGSSKFAIYVYKYSEVFISGTPTISGGIGEFTLSEKITLNTQPADGEVWRADISTGVNSVITDGIFAIPGEGVTLDASKFASAKDGYDLRMNAKGELLLCNHSVSYYGVSNGNGTHNMTCWCGDTVLETDLACSGGMATDMLLASCRHCGAAYGELAPNVHYDIYTENMAEEELQAAVAELLLAGQTEISIYLADADKKMLTAIYAALNSSNVDKDSVKFTFGSQNTVQNENEMLTALKKGGIIILTADIALPPQEDVRENTIIILNGYSLTPGINGLGVEGGCTLTVIGDGNVNGDDGLWVFEGTLDMQSGTVEAMYVCETVSTANIYGGKITFLAVDFGSTANIFGGKITSLTVREDSTVNISGGYVGELQHYSGTLIITGGTFGFDPSAYLAEGYTATEAEGKWTVTQNN